MPTTVLSSTSGKVAIAASAILELSPGPNQSNNNGPSDTMGIPYTPMMNGSVIREDHLSNVSRQAQAIPSTAPMRYPTANSVKVTPTSVQNSTDEAISSQALRMPVGRPVSSGS